MQASNLTNRNKIKIEGRWFKINRVWAVGEEIEISGQLKKLDFGQGTTD